MENGTKDLLLTLLAQFGGVTAATVALTEWLPFMKLFGVGPPFGKRIASSVYAILLSLAVYEMGFVKLPDLAHSQVWLKYLVVGFLGVVSMALAQWSHSMIAKKKPGGTE